MGRLLFLLPFRYSEIVMKRQGALMWRQRMEPLWQPFTPPTSRMLTG